MKTNMKSSPNLVLLLMSLMILPYKIFAAEEESVTETVIKFSAQHYFLTSFIVLIVVGLVARYISIKRSHNAEGKVKRIGIRTMLRRKKRSVA